MPEADSGPILANLVPRNRRMIPPESGQEPKLLDCLFRAPRSGHYNYERKHEIKDSHKTREGVDRPAPQRT
jgi:hypothetical protein